MPTSLMRWTEDNRRLLADMYVVRKMNAERIARWFGVTKAAVDTQMRAMRKAGWDLPHRQPPGEEELTASIGSETPAEKRRATILHLQDILREHGYDKRWPSYDLSSERPRFVMPLRAPRSLTGSHGEMCAENGGYGLSRCGTKSSLGYRGL